MDNCFKKIGMTAHHLTCSNRIYHSSGFASAFVYKGNNKWYKERAVESYEDYGICLVLGDVTQYEVFFDSEESKSKFILKYC